MLIMVTGCIKAFAISCNYKGRKLNVIEAFLTLFQPKNQEIIINYYFIMKTIAINCPNINIVYHTVPLITGSAKSEVFYNSNNT